MTRRLGVAAPVRHPAAAGSVLVALLTALAGCGGHTTAARPQATVTVTAPAPPAATPAQSTAATTGVVSCDDAGPLSATVSPALLAPGLTVPAGAHVYQTKRDEYRYPVVYAWLAQREINPVAARDAAVAALRTTGFRLTSSDQDTGVEATAQLTGPRVINLQVIELCQGRIRLRYTPLGY